MPQAFSTIVYYTDGGISIKIHHAVSVEISILYWHSIDIVSTISYHIFRAYPRDNSFSANVDNEHTVAWMRHITMINILMHGYNGCHFTYNILECIFLNESCCISTMILYRYVPGGPVSIKPALAKIMPWHWTTKPWVHWHVFASLSHNSCVPAGRATIS